jgi:hypothetical protein
VAAQLLLQCVETARGSRIAMTSHGGFRRAASAGAQAPPRRVREWRTGLTFHDRDAECLGDRIVAGDDRAQQLGGQPAVRIARAVVPSSRSTAGLASATRPRGSISRMPTSS